MVMVVLPRAVYSALAKQAEAAGVPVAVRAAQLLRDAVRYGAPGVLYERAKLAAQLADVLQAQVDALQAEVQRLRMQNG
jgi:sorbitol-specific phosphotransferase system component IIBC